MKLTESKLRQIIRSVIREETEYQKFFKKELEKTGKSIPQMSDEEKKAFFNKIDKAWKGKGESVDELTKAQEKLPPALKKAIQKKEKKKSVNEAKVIVYNEKTGERYEDFINENKGDYVKGLSSVIDKYRQDFFIKIQDDIQDILGNKITKKLTYKNEIYYEINVKNRKFRGFFYIKFDKSEYGNEYCGIIYFDSGDRDGHEFFKKSSLIKILQDKQVL